MAQRIAMISNVQKCLETMNRIMNSDEHLGRMAVFYGYSGVGKSMAATMAAHQTRAYYVQCKSTFTRVDFCKILLKEMGITPEKKLTPMVDQIVEELSHLRRPIIIDEFDYMVKKDFVEIVRDIFDLSKAPIMMIGENRLPEKLKRPEWERFYGRVLVWTEAKGITMSDIADLISIYAPGIAFSDCLLKKIEVAGSGSARLASVNIYNIREFCVRNGLKSIAADQYGHPLVTGNGPRGR